MSDPAARAGMARFGIATDSALGISVARLRQLAREIGPDHNLALELWDSGLHEARILASMLADPRQADSALLDTWAADFNSWDLCDQCCNNFFRKTAFARAKIFEWCPRQEEFLRRAGFVMICVLAVHDRQAPDHDFEILLELVEKYAFDERNFVKKAVNWALRQIGKRNRQLNLTAIACAERIAVQDSPAARWIATDALRELRNPRTRMRMQVKS